MVKAIQNRGVKAERLTLGVYHWMWVHHPVGLYIIPFEYFDIYTIQSCFKITQQIKLKMLDSGKYFHENEANYNVVWKLGLDQEGTVARWQ